MAELTATPSPCCAPEAQATCCEPSEKSACCGTREAGGACGCSVGQTHRVQTSASSAIIRARKPQTGSTASQSGQVGATAP
jgi:hypothetical protein